MYIPDPLRYQQLGNGDPYGGYNCTAWGAAFRVDAHSKGSIKTTGTQVRAHSDERRPDPSSPGLNLGQVDAAVIDITNGRVNLDTRAQERSLPRSEIQWRIVDGRFCGLSVNRGVLVNRGWASGFTGAHDITIFVREGFPNNPVMFDPLVKTLRPVSWDAAFDAAESLTPGHIYAQFTRDATPDYKWVLFPKPPAKLREFYRFREDGRIIGKYTTAGTDVACTPPRYVPGTRVRPSRWLVTLIAPGHNRNGWHVNARYAEELNP
jgi:hypothetical protein